MTGFTIDGWKNLDDRYFGLFQYIDREWKLHSRPLAVEPMVNHILGIIMNEESSKLLIDFQAFGFSRLLQIGDFDL